MDSIDNKLLQLRPDTVMTVRKMYNLDKPGDIDKAVDVLEDWLKKQHHLTKRDYPRDFLERSIIFMKGSVERAKSQINNLCSMKVIYPKFFEKYDARNDFNHLDSHLLTVLLPKLTAEHYRVYAVHFIDKGTTTDMIMDCYRYGMVKCEYIKAHDYCAGFIAIIDFRKADSLELLANADFIAVYQLIRIIMGGYSNRIKGLHFITQSKAVETLLRMIKPMLGPKVSKRIQVHETPETVYDYVPKDILPCEFGGYEESIAVLSERFKNVVGTKENVEYMREMSKAVSNEAHNMGEKVDNLDLGLAGTFRSLSID